MLNTFKGEVRVGMIPNELFKYRDFGKYTILSLLTEGIWIPKPAQLNDPFDAQLKMSNSGVSFEEFKSTLLSVHASGMKEIVESISTEYLESLFENNKPSERLREEIKQFSQWWDNQSKKIGILSLSEDPQSTTMWSHYGDNHTGICIGYNPEKLAKLGVNSLRKVDYLEEHEIIRNAYLLFAKSGGGLELIPDIQPNQFLKSVSTKSIDWGYEKEWRFLWKELGGNSYQLKGDEISSITFGLRTSSETKQALTHLIIKPIKWFQAIRCDSTIGLERVALNKKSEYWQKPYEE